MQRLGSVRGRPGFDGGAFLLCPTGGVALAGWKGDNGIDTDSHLHVGGTVGAGVEIAATGDLSIDLLQRYSDCGAQDDALGAGGPMHLTAHQVASGPNWHF